MKIKDNYEDGRTRDKAIKQDVLLRRLARGATPRELIDLIGRRRTMYRYLREMLLAGEVVRMSRLENGVTRHIYITIKGLARLKSVDPGKR